ncbi:MAG: hypothetical protein GXO43_06705 [Crenarchaeota archaeon]|nr:hypothetical protein [Thermoproteota archaeon]
MITGISIIDDALGPVPRHWMVEFYGDEKLVDLVMHYTVAYRSRYDTVYLVINTDFGGLDPYLVSRLARRLGGSIDNIMVSRAFRINDLIGVLETLEDAYGTLVVKYPFTFIPQSLGGYREAARIVGVLRRLTRGLRIVLFNTRSRLGRIAEGGKYHSHSVHVIAELRRRGDRGYLVLRKYPGPREGLVSSFPLELLEGWGPWGVQRRLTEWLSIGS